VVVEGNRYNERGEMETVSIRISAGKITEVHVCAHSDVDLPLIMPGFIDIHIHGGGGADTMDATPAAFETISRTHARYGTTGLLLTTVTESVERIDAVIDAASKHMKRQSTSGGAEVLGLHLEGPFIHPDRAGAQRSDRIIQPNVDLAEHWFSSGIVKMMTLAPEVQGAHDVASVAVRHGVLPAIGHTTASFDDVAAAKSAGFRHMTHLCNAMPPLLHRAVGPIGYLVGDDDFTADIICDGIHVDAMMLKTLLRAVGSERLMLITDAIRAAVMPAGRYDLGGVNVTLQDGACRLADGTLAGSVLTMSTAVRRLQQLGGVSARVAQNMASANPARRLNLPHKGQIAPNFDADLVAFDRTGEVLWTMIGGTKVYEV